jgi:hypothetical protein
LSPQHIPVDAIGHLTLVDARNRTIAIAAHGPEVEVGFPDLGSARQAYAALARRSDSNRAVRLVQRELQRADLALRFSVRGVTVARLSGHSQGNLFGRAMRLGGTDVRLRGVLRALLPW